MRFSFRPNPNQTIRFGVDCGCRFACICRCIHTRIVLYSFACMYRDPRTVYLVNFTVIAPSFRPPWANTNHRHVPNYMMY